MKVGEDEYWDGFLPLGESLNSERGIEEVDSFLTALAVEYFLHMPETLIETMSDAVLVNLMILTDWFRGQSTGKVCLYLLARVCQVAKCEEYFAEEFQGLISDIPVHPGSWGAVFVEIAVRVAEYTKSVDVCPVLAVILAMRIPKTQDIAPTVWNLVFQLLVDGFDDPSQKLIVRAMHWKLSGQIHQKASFAALILRQAEALQRIYTNDPTFVECRELLEWMRAQHAVLKKLSDSFTHERVIEALQNPDNTVETYKVGEAPPQVAFDFRAHFPEILGLLTDRYFRRFCHIEVPYR
jgi:hypothetical protein